MRTLLVQMLMETQVPSDPSRTVELIIWVSDKIRSLMGETLVEHRLTWFMKEITFAFSATPKDSIIATSTPGVLRVGIPFAWKYRRLDIRRPATFSTFLERSFLDHWYTSRKAVLTMSISFSPIWEGVQYKRTGGIEREGVVSDEETCR